MEMEYNTYNYVVSAIKSPYEMSRYVFSTLNFAFLFTYVRSTQRLTRRTPLASPCWLQWPDQLIWLNKHNVFSVSLLKTVESRWVYAPKLAKRSFVSWTEMTRHHVTEISWYQSKCNRIVRGFEDNVSKIQCVACWCYPSIRLNTNSL